MQTIANRRGLKSLARLIEDEDPKSSALVREHILAIGDPMLPFLKEAERSKDAQVRGKAAELASEIHFKNLRDQFQDFVRGSRGCPDLEAGAFLIARFEHPRLEAAPYRAWLDHVAEQARAEGALLDEAAAFKRLNSFLTGAMGFCVNEENYYQPDNSCLNRVIETRRGTPAALSVLFLLLARRLQIPASGIALPGHFVTGLNPPGLFWDPLLRRVLDLPAFRHRLAQNGFSFVPRLLRPSSSAQILARLLMNMAAVYDAAGSERRVDMLEELFRLLPVPR